jgi:hypothetical protein
MLGALVHHDQDGVTGVSEAGALLTPTRCCPGSPARGPLP